MSRGHALSNESTTHDQHEPWTRWGLLEASALTRGMAIVIGLVLLAGPGCGKRDAEPKATDQRGGEKAGQGAGTAAGDAGSAAAGSEQAAIETQWYRVVLLDKDMGEVPFFLSLPSRTGKGSVVNGEQSIDTECTWQGSEVTVRFSGFDATITLRKGADGMLTGQWVNPVPAFGTVSREVRLTPVPAPDGKLRFEPLPETPDAQGKNPGKAAGVAGIWRLSFPESGLTKLTLQEQSPGVIIGVLHNATGSINYLAGNLMGNQLRLSMFNITSFGLLTAELTPNGKALKGRWISGHDSSWKEEFTGQKAARDFPLPSPLKTDPDEEFYIEVLTRPPYEGKPVIVELGGNWCINCKYLAVVLRDLYKKHHAEGLEILTLLYEFTDDEQYNKQEAEEFKRNHNIPWEVIPVNGTLDDFWEIIPPGLAGNIQEAVFPVTIFVNPDGTVRHLHSGFPMEIAKQEYAQAVELYSQLAADLLERARARPGK